MVSRGRRHGKEVEEAVQPEDEKRASEQDFCNGERDVAFHRSYVVSPFGVWGRNAKAALAEQRIS